MDVENTEQQQNEQTATPTDGTVSRDELLAAVREAGGAESVDVAAEEKAAQEKAAAAPETPQAEDPDARLERILKAREQAHKTQEEAKNYAAQQRQAAEEQARKLIEEARAEAKRIAEAELEAQRAKYRSSPTAYLRAVADDPQEVVDAVLKEGTPEARALAKQREETREALELAKEGKSAREEITKLREEIAAEKRALYEQQVKREFMTEYATEEKAPYLHARFDSDEVFERCNALCKEWQAGGLALGTDFDRGDLVNYLEKQSRERLSKVAPSPPAHQVSAGAPAKGPGLAPKVSANGTRTLSAAAGSERRTSPRPLSEMKPEEARAALMEEVAAARRANPEAPF